MVLGCHRGGVRSFTAGLRPKVSVICCFPFFGSFCRGHGIGVHVKGPSFLETPIPKVDTEFES